MRVKFPSTKLTAFVLADYRSYIEAQDKVGEVYSDKSLWAEMAIRNVAGSGKLWLAVLLQN